MEFSLEPPGLHNFRNLLQQPRERLVSAANELKR